MKTTVKIFSLAIVVLVFACSKDDPTSEPQQQIEPTPEPEHENQPPSRFSATTQVDKNTVLINWDATIDPDGDTVTYEIMLGDSLIASQTETALSIEDLVFEKEYEGKIIADDGNDHTVETTFDFSTGFLWLNALRLENYPKPVFKYNYNDSEQLISIERPGHTVHIVYDTQGKLFSFGNYTYTWNSNGQLTTVSDGTGKGDLQLSYNNNDRLQKIECSRVGSNNFSGNTIVTITYNTLGRITQVDEHTIYSSNNTDGIVEYYNKRKIRHDNGGNIIEDVWSTSEDGIEYERRDTYEYEYDTHKNPNNSLIKNQLGYHSPIVFGLTYEITPLSPPNYIMGYEMRVLGSSHNITNWKQYDRNFRLDPRTFEYEYNSSGYPTSYKATVFDIVDEEEYEYFYDLTYQE